MIESGVLSHCAEKQCTVIKCKVRELLSQEVASIELVTRVNVRSLKEVMLKQIFNISCLLMFFCLQVNPSDPPTVGSILLTEISKLPFIQKPGHLDVYYKQISTDIVPKEN